MHLRFQGRATTLAPGDTQPADRTPAAVLRRLHVFHEVGTLGDEYRNLDPFDSSRTYGVMATDRTHMLNVSWNAFLPDGAKGSMDNAFGKGLLNGWQFSGSRFCERHPDHAHVLGRSGRYRQRRRLLRHAGRCRTDVTGGNARAPIYTCDPRVDNNGIGEKILKSTASRCRVSGSPATAAEVQHAHAQPTNTDLTLFKNFATKGTRSCRSGSVSSTCSTRRSRTPPSPTIEPDAGHGVQRCPVRRAERRRWNVRRLRRLEGLPLYAAVDRELRHDQHQARPPRD